MSAKRISYCQGKGSLAHNNREFIFKNVDPKRTRDNVIYVSQSIDDAYERCFGKATEEFNAKQKRADRKIKGSYFKYLFGEDASAKRARTVLISSDKRKSFYEDLVQIGDKDDSGVGSQDGKLVAQCLDEYMKGFRKRNTSFYVFNAVMHCDEATPHLHIDYIPVGDYSKKRGMDRQNGIAQALEDMGHGKGKDAINRWRLSERDVLESICREHGIDIATPEKSRGYSLTPDDYKAQKDAEKVAIETKIADLAEEKHELERTIPEMRKEALESRQSVSKAQEGILAAENEKTRLEDEMGRLRGELKPYLALEVAVDDVSNNKHEVSRPIIGGGDGSKDVYKVPRKDYERLKQQAKAYVANKPVIQTIQADRRKLTEREKSVKAREDAADGREHGLQDFQKQLADKYNEQLNLNNLYLKEKDRAAALEAQNITLKKENTRLQQIVNTLTQRLRDVWAVVKSIVQAVGMLKYGKNKYNAGNLTPEQSRLVEAVSNYGAEWAEKDGYPDIAKDMRETVDISQLVKSHIKELEPKSQDRER